MDKQQKKNVFELPDWFEKKIDKQSADTKQLFKQQYIYNKKILNYKKRIRQMEDDLIITNKKIKLSCKHKWSMDDRGYSCDRTTWTCLLCNADR